MLVVLSVKTPDIVAYIISSSGAVVLVFELLFNESPRNASQPINKKLIAIKPIKYFVIALFPVFLISSPFREITN